MVLWNKQKILIGRDGLVALLFKMYFTIKLKYELILSNVFIFTIHEISTAVYIIFSYKLKSYFG